MPLYNPVGTMAAQNAGAVAITGGSAVGMTAVRVGTASPVGILEPVTVAYNAGSTNGMCLADVFDGGTGTAINFFKNGAQVGTITTTNSATAYNTSSDRRLKCNIRAAGDAGAIIDAIEIVAHDWNNGAAPVAFGVIAQDLWMVAPIAVTPGDDGDEIERQWEVDYSKMVPVLIREAQSLRRRLKALEGGV